eukprot:Cvel_7428.t2-p1 / transcript=Cvel_7428.t2 / gene=Cvel_7428 / organism=Chromera_velia_CCMP2878 / gene_product=hypothetical protein / transcript_product=hypothetical protein / location=Cvel_scaffold388:50970-51854(+) / protein_length=295 / sequence_SO=supercontig / SO=protein_coding / is_pseudo=false
MGASQSTVDEERERRNGEEATRGHSFSFDCQEEEEQEEKEEEEISLHDRILRVAAAVCESEEEEEREGEKEKRVVPFFLSQRKKDARLFPSGEAVQLGSPSPSSSPLGVPFDVLTRECCWGHPVCVREETRGGEGAGVERLGEGTESPEEKEEATTICTREATLPQTQQKDGERGEEFKKPPRDQETVRRPSLTTQPETPKRIELLIQTEMEREPLSPLSLPPLSTSPHIPPECPTVSSPPSESEPRSPTAPSFSPFASPFLGFLHSRGPSLQIHPHERRSQVEPSRQTRECRGN